MSKALEELTKQFHTYRTEAERALAGSREVLNTKGNPRETNRENYADAMRQAEFIASLALATSNAMIAQATDDARRFS